ncbi:MAG: phosphopantothenoylcysteine decarboxylase [Phycisphaerae bacterium]|nr:phosphopantothenoylcysteine decarboxylase [Phycisphaerae bacterium]NIS53374.1 phosphopantothenoylcysteine decarboxylase [Phycisphaerae bacterium]NIU08566.1 phosphopantothenoylcysteine decarboxylase [Phycisphaerae bacterium]NIU58701.1 phosphopantothenoylcysteine decarboxylase [Phycisphaerae bacterium]NIW94987.1 phosphopantothenoylcysteine decarboxylase [Phycisphaerae bacterium]
MHLLITAGGTREYIDPVRFITNASSGKMGYALAGAAQKAGHKVTLISASDLQPPVGVEFVGVDSAAEMFEEVKKYFSQCDCLIMAAAVADYTPAQRAKTKIKKTGKSLTIKLKPTADILKWAGKNKKKNQIVVGFALEDKAIRTRAEKKLKEKNLDMIIANEPAAIGADKSMVQMKTSGSPWTKIENATKIFTAKRIIRLIQKL